MLSPSKLFKTLLSPEIKKKNRKSKKRTMWRSSLSLIMGQWLSRLKILTVLQTNS